MSIEWKTVLAVAIAIIIAGLVKTFVIDKAVSHFESYDNGYEE